jgi:hypothetical protein
MKADIATELNYLWKVKAVGGSYMDPATQVLQDSPAGEIFIITILTEDHDIEGMWENGRMSL